jgi:glutamate dehydrogenase (NAD(P)+)
MIKIEKKLTEAFTNVQMTAIAQKTDWRTAAYILAIKRIETAYTQRGIFP